MFHNTYTSYHHYWIGTNHSLSSRVKSLLFEEYGLDVPISILAKYCSPESSSLASAVYKIHHEPVYLEESTTSDVVDFKNILASHPLDQSIAPLFGTNIFIEELAKAFDARVVYVNSMFNFCSGPHIKRPNLLLSTLYIRKALKFLFVSVPLCRFWRFRKSDPFLSSSNYTSIYSPHYDISLAERAPDIKSFNHIVDKYSIHTILASQFHRSYKKYSRQLFCRTCFFESIAYNMYNRFLFSVNDKAISVQHGGLRGLIRYYRMSLELSSRLFGSIFSSVYSEQSFFNNNKITPLTSPILAIDHLCNRIDSVVTKYFQSSNIVQNSDRQVLLFLSNHTISRSYLDHGLVPSSQRIYDHNNRLSQLCTLLDTSGIPFFIKNRPGRASLIYDSPACKPIYVPTSSSGLAIIDHPGRILLERFLLKKPLIYFGELDFLHLTSFGSSLFELLDKANLHYDCPAKCHYYASTYILSPESFWTDDSIALYNYVCSNIQLALGSLYHV